MNVRVLRDGKLVDEDIWIKGGKIIDDQARFWEARDGHEWTADQVIDGKGCIASPGFIDLQINGARGVDFSSPDLTEEQLTFVAQWLLQSGVTAFCPTLVTSAPETYRAVLPLLRPRAGSIAKGATVLGAHLEGPFLSKSKYGAHKKDYLVTEVGDDDALTALYGPDWEAHARMLTLAPELPGALAAVRRLAPRRVAVCVGHTEARVDCAQDAHAAGAGMITHLYNAHAAFHHRDPGVLGLIGMPGRKPHYGIIADGIHSHPFAVNMAWRTHPEGTVLVTDAIQALGLPPGTHQLGDMSVEIAGSRAYVSGTQTLAGSVTSMDLCVINFARMTGCPIERALEAATLHPARVLGLEGTKGVIAQGADADIVLLGDDLRPVATFVAGFLAWSKPGLDVVPASRSVRTGPVSVVSSRSSSPTPPEPEDEV